VIRVPVTNLDKFAAYLRDDEFPLDVLLRELRGQVLRTPAMERGHAFAKAMEQVGKPELSPLNIASVLSQGHREDETAGDRLFDEECPNAAVLAPPQTDLLIAEGHAFAFTCDAEIEAWPRRELKAEKDYGGIIVSGRCDRLHGMIIEDDKTTSHFSGDAGVEKYIDKWQWRYYLDIFGAHEFMWHIWETREIDITKHGDPERDYPGVKSAWEIFNHHIIRNYRYPQMETECREFALKYKEFAERAGLAA
jgi:hypothetical protein